MHDSVSNNLVWPFCPFSSVQLAPRRHATGNQLMFSKLLGAGPWRPGSSNRGPACCLFTEIDHACIKIDSRNSIPWWFAMHSALLIYRDSDSP
jgi:hypothetical protein